MISASQDDLVCTDMIMRKLSGDKFIEISRKLPNGKIPYILITGSVTSKTRAENIDFKDVADSILIKPFGHEHFVT
jgi:CheY-like chemotaxis protein